MILLINGTEQSKADPCAFRKVVDGEVTLIVSVHVDDLVVAAKDNEVFDAFYTQRLEVIFLCTLGARSTVTRRRAL